MRVGPRRRGPGRPDDGAAPAVPLSRLATDADVPALRELDAVCFPAGDPTRQPAAEDELERGVRQQAIQVREVDGRIVAFLHVEMLSPHHAYISALAVDPDHRRSGLASVFLDEVLRRFRDDELHEAVTLSTATSPDNVDMLSLLLSRGFVVRDFMQDYFGPGRHRFYCQHKVRTEYVDPDERYIVPASAFDHLASLLTREDHAITALLRLPAGPAFEVSRFERDDFASLQSDECAAGIAFSSGLLAAVTFVLGFSFASSNYPDAVRVLLMGSALSTVLSLIMYANASGELARIRSNVFGRHMKWGNILSEFGGVFPFLIVLPVTFGEVTSSFAAAVVTAAVFSATLFLYERSGFCMTSRFARNRLTLAYSVVVCSAPVTGLLAAEVEELSWLWTAVVAAVLAAQAIGYLRESVRESATSPHGTGWQVRR